MVVVFLLSNFFNISNTKYPYLLFCHHYKSALKYSSVFYKRNLILHMNFYMILQFLIQTFSFSYPVLPDKCNFDFFTAFYPLFFVLGYSIAHLFVFVILLMGESRKIFYGLPAIFGWWAYCFAAALFFTSKNYKKRFFVLHIQGR